MIFIERDTALSVAEIDDKLAMLKRISVGGILIVILATINNSFSWMSSLVSVIITVGYNVIYNKVVCQKIIKMGFKKEEKNNV